MDVKSEQEEALELTVNKDSSAGLLLRLDLLVLPPLALLWLIALIDQASIGNAQVAGLSEDLDLRQWDFNVAVGLFWVGHIISEPPSAFLLRSFGGKWLAFLMFCWGIVTLSQGFISNYKQLVALRFLLGLCEGGFLPGVTYYLSTLYRRQELQLRIALFYAAGLFAGTFSGLMAFGIVRLRGVRGRPGWAWIFILEGTATCVIALVAIWLLPRSLADARSLNQSERRSAMDRIRSDADFGDLSTKASLRDDLAPAASEEHEAFEWREVRRAFRDPQTWFIGLAQLCIDVPIVSTVVFAPTIISNLGFTGPSAQLHSALISIPAAVVAIFGAVVCDRLRVRGPAILLFDPIGIAGYLVAIFASRDEARYATLFLIYVGVFATSPSSLALLVNNLSGLTKRNTSMTFSIMLSDLGGIIGSFIYNGAQAPRFVQGHTIVLGFLIAHWILIACNVLYCFLENRARRRGQRGGRLDEWKALTSAGRTKAPPGDRDPAWRLFL